MKISGFCRKGKGLHYFFTPALMVLTAGSAGAASEGGGGGITVIPDISVLIQIANFLFLIWALNMILYKPIRKMLQQRKEKVQSFENTIATFDQDIQEKDEALITGQKAARAKGIKEKEALMQAAIDEENRILADVNAKAQEEFAEVRAKIKRDVEVARDSLQNKVDEFANDISQKILGRTV